MILGGTSKSFILNMRVMAGHREGGDASGWGGFVLSSGRSDGINTRSHLCVGMFFPWTEPPKPDFGARLIQWKGLKTLILSAFCDTAMWIIFLFDNNIMKFRFPENITLGGPAGTGCCGLEATLKRF